MADLWAWNVVISEAVSGKVEVVWQTQSTQRRDHRQRERAMPVWCEEVWKLVDLIDFSHLPPNRPWPAWLDDADVLTLERQSASSVASFSVFYAPKLWPALPESTRAALLQLIATLDSRARTLHAAV